jgi:hypothetical protein
MNIPTTSFLKALGILVICPMAGPLAWAEEPAKPPAAEAALPATWETLEKQAKDLAADVAARDVHALHKLDYAVRAETAELQKGASAQPAARAEKLGALLTDIAKQASRAHHDGHAEKWDDAAAAQTQFAADLRAAAAIISSSPN